MDLQFAIRRIKDFFLLLPILVPNTKYYYQTPRYHYNEGIHVEFKIRKKIYFLYLPNVISI